MAELEEAGHKQELLDTIESPHKTRKPQANSVLALHRNLLGEHCVRVSAVVPGKRRQDLWMCRRCPWVSNQEGATRVLEHLCNRSHTTEATVKGHLEGMNICWNAEKKETVAHYRAQGNRTGPCVSPVSHDRLRELCLQGVPAAALWVKLLELDAEGRPAESKALVCTKTYDVERARRFQLLAAVCQGHSFRNLSNHYTRSFLSVVNEEYVPPSDSWVRRTLKLMDKEVQALLDERLVSGSMLCIAADGATNKLDGYHNVVGVSAAGEIYLLEQKWMEGDAADASFLVERIRPFMKKCVIGCTMDNAANCRSAQEQLLDVARTTGMPWLNQGCLEHGAQLLTADIVGITPWAQVVEKRASAALNLLRKKKRAYGVVRSAQFKQGKAARVLKKKRKTRHNSVCTILESFYKNVGLIQGLWEAPDQRLSTALFKGLNVAQKKRIADIMRPWFSNNFKERARRMKDMLQPLKLLSKLFASMRLPQAWPCWKAWCDCYMRQYRTADFVDPRRKEMRDVRNTRAKKVMGAIRAREKFLMAPSSKAAMLFDPRWMSEVTKDTTVWLKNAWQEATTALYNGALASLFPSVGGHAAFLKEMDMYLTKQELFHGIRYPTEENTVAEVRQWWETRQPSTTLRFAASACWAMQCSQGESERSWARLSMQSTAMRNRLRPTTKDLLLRVTSNAALLGMQPAPLRPHTGGDLGVYTHLDRLADSMQIPNEGAVLEASDDEPMESSSSSSSDSDL